LASRNAAESALALDWELGVSSSLEGSLLLPEIGDGKSLRRNVFRGPRGTGLVLIVLVVAHRKAGARKLLFHIEESTQILDMNAQL
jgi:hypothetical protein